MKLLTHLLITLLFIPLGSYSQASKSELKTEAEFKNFSGTPLTSEYGQVSALKVVYDLEFERFYFVNSEFYKLHYEFCRAEIYNVQGLIAFNRLNYSSSKKRRFLLGNINHFQAFNTYALELSPSDRMVSEHIEKLYKKVSELAFMGDSLKLLVNSGWLESNRNQLSSDIPILTAAEVYKNQKYQAIGKHEVYGVLRFVENLELEIDQIQPTDIIVIKGTPQFLPEVSGVITDEFQTPLSHLTILGQNREIPIAAYKNAFELQKLRKLKGQKVRLKVLSDSLFIEKVDRLKSNRKRMKKVRLKSDLKPNVLIGVKHIRKQSFTYVGNKAANFGVLYDLGKKEGFKTPESAFAIPFYFYDHHVRNSMAQTLINELLQSKGSITKKDSLKARLKEIRREIRNAPMDSYLLRDVQEKIKSLGSFTRMRFRSSTNAEDAEGFSGAGLYSSKTGILGSKKKPIDKAIKKVWASLWSYEAFMEREYFEIDHSKVYMGVLVHRSFPAEKVNGVAITKHLYRRGSPGFVINAQLGDESVVKPKPQVVCDQFICYPNSQFELYNDAIDIITTSNLNNNQLTMTDEEILNLANTLEKIKRHFRNQTLSSVSYENFAVEVEFKLEGEDRELYVKQVRFYND